LGVEFFQADGQTHRQTDMKKRIVAFRNFAKAPDEQKQTINQEFF